MYDLLEDGKAVLFYVLLGERGLEAELWTFIECTLSLDEVTVVHQLPGPAHWSFSANHPLRTDFVLSVSCLKRQNSEGLKNFVLHHKLRGKIKICGWIFLLCWTVAWGACWTLTFPLKPGIAVLVLWRLRKSSFRSLLLLLFSVWDNKLVISQTFLESQAAAEQSCLCLPLGNGERSMRWRPCSSDICTHTTITRRRFHFCFVLRSWGLNPGPEAGWANTTIMLHPSFLHLSRRSSATF